MSNYTQSTNFATKDALPSGDPLKIVKGTEINTEFNNISVAIATKADLTSPTFTGNVTGTFVGGLTGNVTGNVTGNITGNVTGNATTATTATTAAAATTLVTAGFSIIESGGKLVFKYGTTTIASMSSTGVFTAISDIEAGGTP